MIDKEFEKKFLRRLRSYLRREWRNSSKARKAVYLRTREIEYKLKKDGTPSKRFVIDGYICEGCGELQTTKKELEVHHKIPCGTLTLDNFKEFVNRLWSDDLLGLCRECHKKETKREKKERKK